MHQKEVQDIQVRIHHLAMRKRDAELVVAHNNVNRVQDPSRSQFQRQYPPQRTRTSPHPLSSYLDVSFMRPSATVHLARGQPPSSQYSYSSVDIPPVPPI